MRANDYRAYAIECLIWASDPDNHAIQHELLELAKAWEEAALELSRNAAAEPNKAAPLGSLLAQVAA